MPLRLAQLLCLFTLGILAQAQPAGLEPQSREAWHFMALEGEGYAPLVYTVGEGRLRCEETSVERVKARIETRAAEDGLHPAYLAEALAAYAWDDWSRLQVTGYDLREVVSHHPEQLEPFLEQAYREHHPCLLGILKVLVAGYEGAYQENSEGRYEAAQKTGPRYRLVAFNPAFFPGTGLLEPLGVVYAVRLTELMRLDALRQPMLHVMAATLQKRAAQEGDPLKVR